MPKITYTTEKGLVQSTGSGFVGGVFMKPGYTAVAGSTLAIPLTHGVVNKTTGGAEAPVSYTHLTLPTTPYV